MKGIPLFRAKSCFLIVLLISGVGFFVTRTSYADPLDTLKAGLPGQVAGWRTEAPDRFYDERTIFDYIDGGAEIYRSYNMKGCLSRRYTLANGPAIVLDIFDMGSSDDAFGVFTHDLDGDPLPVGQDARYRAGWLSFWKDRYFISVYAEAETDAAKSALVELGTSVASQIPNRGTKPPLLLRLPKKGLQQSTIRFLHDDTVLNYHYYVSDENILLLGPQTDAALALYRRDPGQAMILLVAYLDQATAARAHAGFLADYLPDADPQGMVLMENGKWAAARIKDKAVVIVLEADSRQLARELLDEIMGSPPRSS